MIADVSSLRSALLGSLADALVAAALAALIGIAISRRLRSGIARPIVELTRVTEEISRSADYSRRVPGARGDEIGRLVDAFNGMLDEIAERDAALKRQRDRLADEVAERTRELALAKEAAERANTAKSEFLATMSHEIRTPMNGMLVMAELVAADAIAPKVRRHAEIIVKSGEVLLALINDILDLSKIEAGHLEFERTECDPALAVEDVLHLLDERASASGLELSCYVAPQVPASFVGDPGRLRQVLSNLVNNAIKFTETGGVLVSLETVAGQVAASDCPSSSRIPASASPSTSWALSSSRSPRSMRPRPAATAAPVSV